MEDETKPDLLKPSQWDPKKSLSVISLGVLIGLVVVVIQAAQLSSLDGFIGQAAIMIAISGASVMLGGFGGFLFGIPRRLQNDGAVRKQTTDVQTSETDERQLYEGNTNLEQISDWLTKIIVGVTLVKLGDIVEALNGYGYKIAVATGRPSDGTFSVGLMIFFFICGFLIGYLWSRLFLGRAPTEAESRIHLQKKLNRLEQQVHADAEAIGLARRQLSAEEGSRVSPEDIARGVTGASFETISHIFYLAQNNRWRNWESNKEQMEKSIPIFQALMLHDPQGKYHRNTGQLAYCLKDANQPDWKQAENLFTRAILSRGDAQANGWSAYEANRAIVRIKLETDFTKRFGNPEDAKAAIVDDLRTAFSEHWVAEWLTKDPTVSSWMKENRLKLPMPR
jgi:hypothetical protein